MSAFAALWGTLGVVGSAALVALLGDSVRSLRPLSRLAGLMLLGSGGVWLWFAWTHEPALVSGSYAVGGGFAGGAGLVAVLGGIAAFAGVFDAERRGQQVALIALGVAGSAVAAVSLDVVSLMIGLEIAAASAYALVASARSSASGEAALKYFIQGAVATGLALLSVAVLVGGIAADGRYASVSAAIGGIQSRPILFAVMLLVAVLVFKAGGAPFHSWAPDAYQSAPSSASAFLASGAKVGAIAALAVLVGSLAGVGASPESPVGVLGGALYPVLAGLAGVSIVVGSLLALKQTSYTRLLGYAGVAQVGYALLALASGNPTVALLFIATYAVASAAAFLGADAAAARIDGWDGTVDGLAGLGRRSPALGVALTFVLLSMAGIPPLVGFWGKFQSLQSAVSATLTFQQLGQTGVATGYSVLIAVALGGAVVSLAYYGRIVRVLFSAANEVAQEPVEQGEGDDPGAPSGPRVDAPLVAVILLAGLVAGLGLLPLFVPITELVAGFIL